METPKPRRKKSLKTKRIEQLDGWWSKCVRLRDDYRCQKHHGEPSKYAEAMHVISRGNLSTRWDVRNGITGCYYCHHMWGHRQPREFTAWAEEHIGEMTTRELAAKAQVISNWSETMYEETLVYLKEYYQQLLNEGHSPKPWAD